MTSMTEGNSARPDLEKRPDIVWLAACGLITIVASVSRFYALELKPLHHDEGVNGFFLTTLFRDGVYKYDPANYHGPTLYYISLAFTELFGLNTTAVRASVAVFGVLTVVLTLFLRRYLGRIGSLAAALFLGLSPGMVFISRYFIHEMFFVFCSLGVVVAVVFFIEKQKAGPFAIGWLILLLFVCFLPSGLNLASALGGASTTAVWAFRIAFFIIESVLVYFVVRMLLDWNNGRPVYLLLASASAALLFATKETAFITLGTMLIACFSTWVWRGVWPNEGIQKLKWPIIGAAHLLLAAAALLYYAKLADAWQWFYSNFLGDGRPREAFAFYSIILMVLTAVMAWAVYLYFSRGEEEASFTEPSTLTWKSLSEALGTRNDMLLMVAAFATTFIYLSVLFFSSFFTFGEGVTRAIEAYTIWTKTGTKDHTQNGLLAYLKWGVKVESPILVLSALGGLIALIKPRHRFAVFTAFWAFGLFVAYTIIPYKTPWLALSFYLPMCLIAGYGLNELAARGIAGKAAGALVTLAAVAVLGYQTYDLNFVRYDDEEMGYVYAHSKRGMLDLVKEIERYADKSGKGRDATIEIVSPDYWPLTWYLNDYAHANFNGAPVDANAAEMIVAKKNDQDKDIIIKYAAHYRFVGVYPLRPGVDLMLLVRKDLAEADAKELYKIYEYVSPELSR